MHVTNLIIKETEFRSQLEKQYAALKSKWEEKRKSLLIALVADASERIN